MKSPLLRKLVRTLALCAAAAAPLPTNATVPPPAKSLAQLLAPVMAQAKTRTVRIMMGGTSIATAGISNNQLFVAQLMALYGDARSVVQRMGALGGSWDLPSSGWYKQPYSGPSLVRLRGNSSSQSLPLTIYGSTIIIEYSKESDGGICQVLMDGTPLGSIDCQGVQQLSVKATFPVPLGLHTLTFLAPTNGSTYLERVSYEQGIPGIAVIDGTLGGTGLEHVYNNYPGAGQSVPGIPTQPGAGVAAFFGRPDIDLVIWSGPVNDHGGFNPGLATWKTHVNEMVNSTRGRCPLILIAEMGGHLSLPSDPDHAIYQSQYEYFLQMARDNAHVFTVDWQGATVDSDIQRYVGNYYSSAAYNTQTGQVSGDFIHPNAAAHRVALGISCPAAGMPIPVETTYDQVRRRTFRTSPLPRGSAIAFMDGNTPRSANTSYAGALVLSWGVLADTLPLLYSADSENLSTINADVAASPTSDRYGKFLNYPAMAWLSIFQNVTNGERVTVTALVKSAQANQLGAFQHIFLSPTMYHSNALLGPRMVILTDSEDEPPMWVTFEYQRDQYPYIAFAGRLYSLSVTRTNGQPVSTFEPHYLRAGTVATGDLTGLSATGATLLATANPQNDGAMSTSYEYGTDEHLAGACETLNAITPSGGSDVSVSLDVRGLSPGNIYFYRAKTTFAGTPEPIFGNIRSFLAPPAGDPASAIAMKRLANRRALVGMFGVPGHNYLLSTSPDTVTWAPIGTVTPGPSGSFMYEDADAELLNRRFYRLLTP